MKSFTGKKLFAALLAATWLLPILTASAQGQQRGPGHTTQPAHGRGPGRGPGGARHGPHRVEDIAHSLFGVSPEDQGPLQPGEEEQLLAFAREHTPRLYRAMEWVRQHRPERFREKLAAYAPRLRHLRRVYDRNPQLGTIVQAYAENLIEIERGAAALRRSPAGSAGYECDLQALRNLVAENVQLESDALEALAAELEQRSAQRIERRVAYLTGDEADLAAAPEALRELVAAFQAATADEERAARRDALRAFVEHQVTVEAEALRERMARIRENAAGEVDRRVARLLEGRGPLHKRPPGPPESRTGQPETGNR